MIGRGRGLVPSCELSEPTNPNDQRNPTTMQTYFRRSYQPTFVGTPDSPPAKEYVVTFAPPSVTLEVYVAGADRRGYLLAPVNYREAVQRVILAVEALSDGASTRYQAEGSWRGVSEPVTIVRGNIPVDADLTTLEDTLYAVLVDTNQECVGFTLDGKFAFVRRAVAL